TPHRKDSVLSVTSLNVPLRRRSIGKKSDAPPRRRKDTLILIPTKSSVIQSPSKVMNVIACIISLVLALTSSPDLTETKKASYRELCATLQELAFPQYPNDAVAAGLQGDVLVEIDIGKDGRITAAREQSGPAPLAAAARAAVLQWRFGKGP